MELSPRQQRNQEGQGLVDAGVAADSRSDAAQQVDAAIEAMQAEARANPILNGQDALRRLRKGGAQ
jgi:hypothetical protein